MINFDTGRLNGVIFGLLLMTTLPGCAPAENPLSEGVDTGNAEADTILFGGVVASMDSQIVGATAVAYWVVYSGLETVFRHV